METVTNTNQNPAENPAQESEKKIDKKKVTIIASCVIGVAIIALIIIFFNITGSNKADEAVGLADTEMNDSTRLELYKQGADKGYKSGNRAKLEVAMALYNKGEYTEAIKYLEDASVDSEIAEAGRLTLLGDCYVNTDNYDKALSCYGKAIKASDDNPQIAPFVLVKEANIYRAQGKYEDEYKAYKTIYEKYPEYAMSRNFDIRKYMERAQAQAGK